MPMLSGNISYAFNDSFQIGFGKKVVNYKFSNTPVYHELGGLVIDVFFDDYYLTFGTGTGSAINKFSISNFSLSDVALGNGSFVGFGYEFSEGLNLEFVVGNGKFDASKNSVVTAENITFSGVLLTTYIY